MQYYTSTNQKLSSLVINSPLPPSSPIWQVVEVQTLADQTYKVSRTDSKS